jgi:hypothetical protein
MAVILQMTYQKKLGLPNYSSHSCAVSLTVEIPDVSVAAQESTKLYSLLQTAVDNEIQHVGFIPDATTYGMNNGNRPASNGHPGNANGNGNGRQAASAPPNGDRWNCTDGQKGFILRIVSESSLNKQDVADLAQQLFSTGVRELDKMQASQLIEELLEKTGKKSGDTQRRWSRQPART